MTENFQPPKDIYVGASAKLGGRYGRGVFAGKKIAPGTLIERCPVLSLHDPKERAKLRKTELVNYYFLWGDQRDRASLCLGWGSIYNHSFKPNARYEKMTDDGRMDFYAIKEIKEGEEITINYNGTPTDTRPVRIPGIPAEAGGLPPMKLSKKAVQGVIRRAKLIKKWIAR